jgi:hypothetical protein
MYSQIIKKIAENVRSYNDKHGTKYIHIITVMEPIMVEGVSVVDFEYHSISQSCTSFIAGQIATFEVEKRVNGKYINYKMKPVKPPEVPQEEPPKKTFGYPKDEGRISALSAASTAANYYHQRESTEDKVMAFAERIWQWANSKSSI